jgi:alpha-glucosidase (family GH31 glycosyl hydrolase)
MAQISEALFVPNSHTHNFYSNNKAQQCRVQEEQDHQHHCENLYNDVIQQIKERYKLLPYWHTCFEEHCRSAEPLLRSICLNQGQETNADHAREHERFMVGNGLLVVPLFDNEKLSTKDALQGLEGRWYDYYTKREILSDEEIKGGPDRIGCFVKGGNIIPTFEIRSYVESHNDARESNISLYIALDGTESAKGTMYFDNAEISEEKTGTKFSRKTIEFQKNTLTWRNVETNGFDIHNRVTKAAIMGLNSKVQNAYIVQEGKPKQKIQIVKKEGYVVLEFVALSNKDWKIVLE